MRQLAIGLLATRLRLAALLREHPAIRDEPIPAPGVRAGLAPDARRRRCEQALRFQGRLMPLFPAMHEMTPDAVHEEIQLLAVDFRSMLFESSYAVPSYGRWYREHDQTGAYAFLRLLLQALQWLDRRAAGARAEAAPRRWLLKSPQHLEQLPALLAAFPDARLLQTHRDPVRVTASTCTMIAYGHRVHAARVDVRAVGR